MKKLLLKGLIVSSLFLVMACGQNPTKPVVSDSFQAKIVGEWSEDAGNSLQFNADGTADMISDGESITESFGSSGTYMRYYLHSSIDPMHLDLSLIAKDGTDLGTFKLIAIFVDDDTLIIQGDVENNNRPENFSEDKQQILKRSDGKTPVVTFDRDSAFDERSFFKEYKDKCYGDQFWYCGRLASLYRDEARISEGEKQKELYAKSLHYFKTGSC